MVIAVNVCFVLYLLYHCLFILECDIDVADRQTGNSSECILCIIFFELCLNVVVASDGPPPRRERSAHGFVRNGNGNGCMSLLSVACVCF